MPFENLLYETSEEGIVTIRFNRPDQRNAMTQQMGDELGEAAARVAQDPGARVVVLTGVGKAFCAGGDMKMIEEKMGRSPLENQRSMREFYGRFLRFREVPVPTIAQINGAAIGAGACIALACDIRLAAEDAKLALNFTALGLHPGMGGTWLLPRAVGLSRAAELLFSSKPVSGREAERIALVSRATPAADLEAHTLALAREIAACGPIAVRLTKRALRQSLGSSLEDQLTFEALQQSLTFATEDVREGVAAIQARRPPRFKGK